MKVVAILFALAAVGDAYTYSRGSWHQYGRRPRPQRPYDININIDNVIALLGSLDVDDVSAYYCNFLSRRPRRWSGWHHSSSSSYYGWQELMSYSRDDVSSCLTTYIDQAFNNLTSTGQQRFCDLVTEISTSLSGSCDWWVIPLMEDVCPDAINPPPATTQPPLTQAPTTRPPFTQAPTTQSPATTQAPTTDRECGTSNTGSNDQRVMRNVLTSLRIIGGNDALGSDYPFMVTVFANGLCGGTLLNETHVMTAAHCVNSSRDNPETVTVAVGEFDLANPRDQVDRRIQSITVHPGYRNTTLGPVDDIAILQLSAPVNIDRTNVASVCLPDPGASATLNGRNCTVAGWGLTNDTVGILPNILQDVTIPTYDGDRCDSTFRFTLSQPSRQICAGLQQGGVDSCRGDSGGPLLCRDNENSQWVQYGIVSYGVGCANPRLPGVYTDVSQYLDFIENNIA